MRDWVPVFFFIIIILSKQNHIFFKKHLNLDKAELVFSILDREHDLTHEEEEKGEAGPAALGRGLQRWWVIPQEPAAVPAVPVLGDEALHVSRQVAG